MSEKIVQLNEEVIIDKRDRNNWYNCIPEQADPMKRWEGFSADKLQGNEIRCGEMILAKIPQVPGLISWIFRCGGAALCSIVPGQAALKRQNNRI